MTKKKKESSDDSEVLSDLRDEHIGRNSEKSDNNKNASLLDDKLVSFDEDIETLEKRPKRFTCLCASAPWYISILMSIMIISSHLLIAWGQTGKLWGLYTFKSYRTDPNGGEATNTRVDNLLMDFSYMTMVRELYNQPEIIEKVGAILLIIFSLFWPHIKLVVLHMYYYLPAPSVHRRSVLYWLGSLGKLSLADICVTCMIFMILNLSVAIGFEEFDFNLGTLENYDSNQIDTSGSIYEADSRSGNTPRTTAELLREIHQLHGFEKVTDFSDVLLTDQFVQSVESACGKLRNTSCDSTYSRDKIPEISSESSAIYSIFEQCKSELQDNNIESNSCLTCECLVINSIQNDLYFSNENKHYDITKDTKDLNADIPSTEIVGSDADIPSTEIVGSDADLINREIEGDRDPDLNFDLGNIGGDIAENGFIDDHTPNIPTIDEIIAEIIQKLVDLIPDILGSIIEKILDIVEDIFELFLEDPHQFFVDIVNKFDGLDGSILEIWDNLMAFLKGRPTIEIGLWVKAEPAFLAFAVGIFLSIVCSMFVDYIEEKFTINRNCGVSSVKASLKKSGNATKKVNWLFWSNDRSKSTKIIMVLMSVIAVPLTVLAIMVPIFEERIEGMLPMILSLVKNRKASNIAYRLSIYDCVVNVTDGTGYGIAFTVIYALFMLVAPLLRSLFLAILGCVPMSPYWQIKVAYCSNFVGSFIGWEPFYICAVLIMFEVPLLTSLIIGDGSCRSLENTLAPIIDLFGLEYETCFIMYMNLIKQIGILLLAWFLLTVLNVMANKTILAKYDPYGNFDKRQTGGPYWRFRSFFTLQ